MKKIIAAAFAGILAIVGAYHWAKPGDAGTDTGGDEPQQAERAEGDGAFERPPVKPDAVRGLPDKPYVVKTVITTTGRGEKADWGVKGLASFVLTTYIACDVEIVAREETPSGEIKVVEKRTYASVRQTLDISETDAQLALAETLPLDMAFQLTMGVGAIMAKIPYTAVAGATTMVAGPKVYGMLKALDGQSARSTLDKIGVNIPKRLEESANKFISQQVQTLVPARPSDLEGKSYLISYYQSQGAGSGKAPPLRVNVSHADGSKDLTDEEWLLLRRVNAFMDSAIADHATCKVGDAWEVESGNFECLFDPYVEGRYSGKIMVERRTDLPGGAWHFGVRPGAVAIVADNGTSSGEVRVESGEAEYDPDAAIVRRIVVSGKAAAKQLTKHHMLFNARIQGMCNYRAVMTAEARK